jgi:hypothetical protein
MRRTTIAKNVPTAAEKRNGNCEIARNTDTSVRHTTGTWSKCAITPTSKNCDYNPSYDNWKNKKKPNISKPMQRCKNPNICRRVQNLWKETAQRIEQQKDDIPYLERSEPARHIFIVRNMYVDNVSGNSGV